MRTKWRNKGHWKPKSSTHWENDSKHINGKNWKSQVDPTPWISSRQLMRLSPVFASTETDSMRVAWGPDALYWNLCLLPSTVHKNWQVRHWRPVLFTDKSMFTLSTCDRHERAWTRRGEHYVASIIIQHDQFSGGWVMVWGGLSLVSRTDLHVIANCTLTAVRYRDEILRIIVRTSAGAVSPGFLLVQARVCRQFLDDEGIDFIDWHSRSPDLNQIEYLLDVMSNAAKYPHRLSRSSPMPRSRSGRRSHRTPIADSSGAYPDVVWSAYMHNRAIHNTESHYELPWWNQHKLDQPGISHHIKSLKDVFSNSRGIAGSA